MKIQFHPFQEKHLALFRHWLSLEHIRDIWQEPEDPEEFKTRFLKELPARSVHCFIVEVDGNDLGYIQYYDAHKVGGGWWENEKPGVFGVDLLIGDANIIGKGFGPAIIKEFIDDIQIKEPSATTLIIDPDPTNERAIRAFQKAGFLPEGEIRTPNGAALLMRMDLRPRPR